MLSQYLPYLKFTFRDVAFQGGSQTRQYIIMEEVSKIMPLIETCLVYSEEDFLKISNIHNFFGYLLYEWNTHMLAGERFDLSLFYTPLQALLNPPLYKFCSKCKWSVCQCEALIRLKDIRFGNIRCLTCNWMECKCLYFEGTSKIRYLSRPNKKITKINHSSHENASSDAIDADEKKSVNPLNQENLSVVAHQDCIDFLLKNAKQKCRKCFISHTPLRRWCNKENTKIKVLEFNGKNNNDTFFAPSSKSNGSL